MVNVDILKDDVNELLVQLKSIRENIHSHPELSFQEYKTSELIQNELKKLNINFEIVVDTGVIASIGKGDKCVALRADIDALPINEETNCDFSSNIPGVMHACGHDMHTTMLLGAAMLLKKHENALDGTVKLIFQPGEEKLPGGALKLIESGALDNPTPSVIFGQHVNPAETTGMISINSGTIMASADELYWTIKGTGAHAAQPQLGSDPIIVSANIISQLQSLVNKFNNPLEPVVLSVTSIHGGSATNIIPDEVKMLGTLRTFNNDKRFELLKKIDELSSSIAHSFGCLSSFEPIVGYPPLSNSEDAALLAKLAATELFGAEHVLDFEPKMWAEDFAYYSVKAQIPACFWFLGVKPQELEHMPGLHNPKFLPDDNALLNGTAMLVAVALKALEL